MIDLKNPYIVSIGAGSLIYYLNITPKQINTKNKTEPKDIKQTRLNYAFLTSIIVFLAMQYYISEDTNNSIEPVCTGPYSE